MNALISQHGANNCTLITLQELSKKIDTLMKKVDEVKPKQELISVDEFAHLYGFSKQTQISLRSRLKNPLPYIQIVEYGTIKYKKSVIDKWFENYAK